MIVLVTVLLIITVALFTSSSNYIRLLSRCCIDGVILEIQLLYL